jgi:8-oxo-dGTP pyrophosphatase MutT (NUDIX family)
MEMTKTLSCGVVVLDQDGSILLCHATETEHWDIPKGMPDPGENPLQSALRELDEETGLTPAADRLTELGIFPYRPAKDLHLFAIRMNRAEVDIEKCTCRSLFASYRNGRMIPEMDRFQWFSPDKIDGYASRSLAKLFATRLPLDALHQRLGST